MNSIRKSMVNNYLHIIIAMWIGIIHIAVSLSANAQSKHASLWNIGGFCFDFGRVPTTITEMDHKYEDWYIDNKGKRILTYYKGQLYDENMEEFQFVNGLDAGFFVPNPSNEDIVYYFTTNNYYIINLKEKKIYANQLDNFVMNKTLHIAVHHAECDKIWLISTKGMVWNEYLLTNRGVEKIRDITLNQDNFKFLPKEREWQINLSMDCKHYTMCTISKNCSEVYYGNFDRNTGLFSRVAQHDLNVAYVYNSIVAPDNSRIFYIVRTNNRKFQILEVPIVDNIPQFVNISVLVEKNAGINAYCHMSYGIDGKIYIIETPNRLCSTLSIDRNGSAKYEEIYNFGAAVVYRSNDMLASWFMDLPCIDSSPIDPCADAIMPDIHFDNSFVCYGEALNVVIPKCNSFSFSYTIDDKNETTVTEILSDKYQMPKHHGNYAITKFSVDGCNFVPTTKISAQIDSEIEKPIIEVKP